MRCIILFILYFFFIPSLIASIFDISHLPVGKSLTLISSTTIKVNVGQKVKLSANESFQSLKIKNISSNQQRIQVKIYDSSKERIPNFKIKSGDSAIYPFKESVVLSSSSSLNSAKKSYLQISSNAPLTVMRLNNINKK